METLLIVAYALLPVIGHANDPAYDLRKTAEERRRTTCVRLTQARAHELFPGRVPEPGPRTGTFAQGGALHCAPTMLALDARPAREEAVLSSLTSNIARVTEAAATIGGAGARWTVDAFYPEPHVAAKLAGAARHALAERGHAVSQRVPLLAAGDLLVLRELPASKAFPLACRRMKDAGSLEDGEAFLAVFIVDPSETQLHGGVCRDGAWRWIL